MQVAIEEFLLKKSRAKSLRDQAFKTVEILKKSDARKSEEWTHKRSSTP
jgi:hypothetical protein